MSKLDIIINQINEILNDLHDNELYSNELDLVVMGIRYIPGRLTIVTMDNPAAAAKLDCVQDYSANNCTFDVSKQFISNYLVRLEAFIKVINADVDSFRQKYADFKLLL